MSYVNDTSVLSQFTKPLANAPSLAWLQRTSASAMYLSVVTIMELRRGVEKLPHGSRRTELTAWLASDVPLRYKARILPVTLAIAHDAGYLLAKAAAKGLNINPSDALIASTARVHGFSVATLNIKHFKHLDVPLVDF